MRRPRIIAEQARHAKGLLGWIIASIMARETWAANRRVIKALGIAADDHVIDVGCGHGRSLGALAACAPKGQVVGADPSALMADMAVGRNRRLIRKGRAKIVVAGAEALPFPDATFDKALCVHVVYFWADMHQCLREIARILKSGGRLALLFRTNADAAAVATFPADVYRFPALADMTKALAAAGFEVEAIETAGPAATGPILLLALRR